MDHARKRSVHDTDASGLKHGTVYNDLTRTRLDKCWRRDATRREHRPLHTAAFINIMTEQMHEMQVNAWAFCALPTAPTQHPKLPKRALRAS